MDTETACLFDCLLCVGRRAWGRDDVACVCGWVGRGGPEHQNKIVGRVGGWVFRTCLESRLPACILLRYRLL
jgi:hypothetical protein